MGALPHADLPPGPHRDLAEALHDLHHRAGWPSLRTLARDAGVSHTTVSKAFSSPRIPTWGTLELLVEAMHGDVPVFHHLWLAATSPPERAGGGPPRIAGRAAELAAVRRHLETGTGLLLVCGEAGIGKTKLVATAAETTDVFVATGHCLPLSSEAPLMPVVDLFREVDGAADGRWLREVLDGASRFVTDSLARLLPELDGSADAMPGGNDAWARQRLFAAIRIALTGLAGSRPLAFLLEDLHWADFATLNLVEHLITHDDGVAVVGTWRSDDPATPPAREEWWTRVRRRPGVRTLQLGPLDRDGTAALLALLHTEPPDAQVVDRIHRRALGQPLFTELLAAPGEDDQLFSGLLGDLLDRRVDGLREPGHVVARTLAIMDRALTDAQLREATGLGSAVLAEGLRELEDRRLLAGTGHDVSLRHPLLAEAVRRRTVLTEIVDAHRTVARAMGGWTGVSASEVATHWQAAEEDEPELEWRIMAAGQARARFATGQEVEEWQRVIALWEDPGLKQHGMTLCGAYCAATRALDDSGRGDAAAELMEEAATRLAGVTGRDRARLLATLGATRGYTDSSAALALLGEALEAYEDFPPSADLADLLLELAGHLRHQGRPDEASDAVARAAAVCERVGHVDGHVRAVMNQAWHETMYGDPATGWKHVEAARLLGQASRDPFRRIFDALVVTDMLLKTCAAASSVAEAASSALAAAQEWSIDSYTVAALRSNVAEAQLLEGRTSEAAEPILAATQAPIDHDHFWLYLERAQVEMLRGDLAAAAADFAALDAIPLSSLLNRSEVIHPASELLLWTGQPDLALDLLTGLLDRLLPTDLSIFQTGLLSRAARAAADLGADRPRAHRRLTDLRATARSDLFEAGRVPRDRHAHGLTWAAEMARLLDTASLDRWVAAAAEWDRLRRPHDAAYCRWRAAQVALRDGQGTMAHRLLVRAASDASQHVPLSRAIAATAEDGR